MAANDNTPRTHKGLLVGALLGFWMGVLLAYGPRLWGGW